MEEEEEEGEEVIYSTCGEKTWFVEKRREVGINDVL